MKLGYEDIRITSLDIRLPLLSRFFAGFIVLLIVLGSNFGRSLQKFYSSYTFLIPFVGIWLILLVLLIIVSSTFRLVNPEVGVDEAPLIKKKGLLILTILLTLFFIYFIDHLILFPIERVHLIKYGMLGFLLFYSHGNGSLRRRILSTFILGASFGAYEEVAQHFIPDRVFDLRDILLNVLSIAFGLCYSLVGLQWLRLREYTEYSTVAESNS